MDICNFKLTDNIKPNLSLGIFNGKLKVFKRLKKIVPREIDIYCRLTHNSILNCSVVGPGKCSTDEFYLVMSPFMYSLEDFQKKASGTVDYEERLANFIRQIQLGMKFLKNNGIEIPLPLPEDVYIVNYRAVVTHTKNFTLIPVTYPQKDDFPLKRYSGYCKQKIGQITDHCFENNCHIKSFLFYLSTFHRLCDSINPDPMEVIRFCKYLLGDEEENNLEFIAYLNGVLYPATLYDECTTKEEFLKRSMEIVDYRTGYRHMNGNIGLRMSDLKGTTIYNFLKTM